MFALDGICLQLARALSVLLRLPPGWVSDVCLGCSAVCWGFSILSTEEYAGLLVTVIGLLMVVWGIQTIVKPYAILVRCGRGFIEMVEQQVSVESAVKTDLYVRNGHRLTYVLFRLTPIFIALWFLSVNDLFAFAGMFLVGCSYYSIAQHYFQKART